MTAFTDFTGLQLWLEADAGITVSNNAALGQHGGPLGSPGHTWNDAGTVEGTTDDIFGDTLNADPYRFNPTYRTGIINSLPVVRFLESNTPSRDNALFTNHRVMVDRGSPATGLITTTAFTAFALLRINSFDLDDGGWWWVWGPSGTHPWTGLQVNAVSGSPVLYAAHEAASGGIHSLSWNIALDTWYLVELWHDGTTFRGLVNGCEPQEIASGTMYDVTTSILEIGNPHNADFRDVSWDLPLEVIYDEQRNYVERALLRRMIADKYALTINACGCPNPPDTIADLTLWVEAGINQDTLGNGDPVTPWNEAGAVGTTSYSDLTDGGDPGFAAPHYSTTDGPCSTPVIHFAEALSGATEGLSTEYTGGRQLSPGSSNFDPANSVFAMAAGTYMTLFRVPTLPASSDPAAFLVLDGDRNATIVVANSDYATDFLGLTDDPGDPGNQCDRAIPKLADGVVRVDVLIDDYVASPDFDVRTNDVFRIASFPYVAGQWVLIWFRLGGGEIHIERAGVVGYDFAQDGGFGPQPQFQMSFINGRIAYGTDIKLAFGYRRSLTNGEITALISSYITCGYPCLDFSGGGSACVPTSGLTLYLDSTRVGVLSDGDSIALWPEAGPIANVYPNDMVAGVGFKPTVKALYGGCKVVRFEEDGITHRRMATRTRRFDDAGVDPTIELLSETGFTIIAMGRALGIPTSVSGYEFDFLFDYDSGGNAYIEGGLFNYPTSGVRPGGDFVTAGVHPLFYLYNDDNSPVAEWAWNVPVLPEEWILMVVRWDGTTIRGTINRANEKTNTVSTFSATFPLGWVTGFNDFNSLDVGNRGDIGFLLSYNRYLDNTELNGLLDCLEAQCLGPGGGSGSGVRVRNTQFMRIGAGAGL